MQNFVYQGFPTFDLKITIDNDCVCGLEFTQKGPKLNITNATAFIQIVTNQLDSYVRDSKFIFNLPLCIIGTDHQQKVWRQMLQIPPGSTLSYKDIAENIGSSPRAVGNACGKNKIAILIPCHRVIKEDGKLGGFMQSAIGYTVDIKSWLLKHEGLTLN